MGLGFKIVVLTLENFFFQILCDFAVVLILYLTRKNKLVIYPKYHSQIIKFFLLTPLLDNFIWSYVGHFSELGLVCHTCKTYFYHCHWQGRYPQTFRWQLIHSKVSLSCHWTGFRILVPSHFDPKYRWSNSEAVEMSSPMWKVHSEKLYSLIEVEGIWLHDQDVRLKLFHPSVNCIGRHLLMRIGWQLELDLLLGRLDQIYKLRHQWQYLH